MDHISWSVHIMHFKLNLCYFVVKGTLVKSDETPSNSLDLVFLTYWLPPINGAQLLLEKDIECISDKIKTAMNSKGMRSNIKYDYPLTFDYRKDAELPEDHVGGTIQERMYRGKSTAKSNEVKFN